MIAWATRDGIEFRPGMTAYTREWTASKGYGVVAMTIAHVDDTGRADCGGHDLGPFINLWGNRRNVVLSILDTLQSRFDTERSNYETEACRWRKELTNTTE
jgi:hypothetical protein